MYKILTAWLVLFLLSACSTHEQLRPNQKAFEEEDTYILFALRAEEVGSYQTAVRLFEELYEKSQKKEYLYRALEDMYRQKAYDALLEKLNLLLQDDPKDIKLIRLKVITLMAMKRYKEAQKIAVNLVKQTEAENDYYLVSEIYTKQQQYDMALRYLESAYMKNYDEHILDKMAIILYINLNRKKDAIAKLETHLLLHGCSQLICNRLVGIYSHENNLEGALSVYKRMYDKDKSKKFADKILQIYGYQRDYPKMIAFLEESGADDDMLLQLYLYDKRFKDAAKLAYKLYEKTSNYDYLGRYATYKYEAYQKKMEPKVLNEIIETLREVVQHSDNRDYKNFLGYILIDHDVNVAEGMRYIQEVLRANPQSAYYLDSLAWGYYKLHQCKKAQEIMESLQNFEGADDAEVLLHAKKIEECLKQHKRGK